MSDRTIDRSRAAINIDNVIAVSISLLVPGQRSWRKGAKPGAITLCHGLDQVLARGAPIATHLMAATADREHPASRTVVTTKQKVRRASDKCFHFPELR